MTGTSTSLRRATPGPGRIQHITPETASWQYVEFSVIDITPDETWRDCRSDRETAIVSISGSGRVHVNTPESRNTVELERSSVFDQMGRVVYVPPGTEFELETDSSLRATVGSAPAEGRYPFRVFEPAEMRSEIRGGGQAHRQVIHSLAYPLPAERLILYEVYIPRGTWAAWPPHCHDGREGSPYLEEIYYFCLDRPEGYGHHRNWRHDESYEDVMVVHDGDLVLVPKGYHTTVTCPSANMYFLNYLAGELQDDDRRTPPCFAAEHTWIESDWQAGEWGLPVVTLDGPGVRR